MLHEAISEINGQEIPEVNDTQVDLPINAFYTCNMDIKPRRETRCL